MSQNAETAAGRPSIVPAFRKMLVRLLVLPLLLFLGACGVNDLPTYDEAVKASWAQVENQYRRRADLIPNLVETVKAFAAHERETLLAVVEARKQVVENPPPENP